MALAFDRVVMMTDQGPLSLSVGQFQALPLTERLRAIFEKRLGFFRAGEPVEITLALRSIRDTAKPGGGLL
jgi:hypothetical protein